MKYYIAVDNKPQGPFDIEELITKGITADTLVWNESMAGWSPAGQVPEIEERLNNGTVPPPFPQQGTTADGQAPVQPENQLYHECPKTYLVHAILCTIFCNLILGIVAIIMAVQVESRWRDGRYEDAQKKSQSAKIFALLSFIVGLLASTWSGYYYYNHPELNPFLF